MVRIQRGQQQGIVEAGVDGGSNQTAGNDE
jgi:hypothetical protein